MINEGKAFYYEKSPVCLIYLKILKLYDFVYDKRIYDEAKDLFATNMEIISKEEKSVIVSHLLNYCIRLMNMGNANFFIETLELYKIGLSFSAFIEQNRMAEVTFSNIVSIGGLCKEFDWTRNFIHSYKGFIDEAEREETTTISLGFLAFSSGKYSETIELLISQSFDKPLQIIKSKTLLIRSYFEQFLVDDSYFELLTAQTYSFEKYIRRNKEISGEKAQGFLNFIQYTRKLAVGFLEKDIAEELINAIELEPVITFKKWLLQKVGKVEEIEERASK